MIISIGDMRAGAFNGLTSIDISTAANAEQAVTTINNAIEVVSSVRSNSALIRTGWSNNKEPGQHRREPAGSGKSDKGRRHGKGNDGVYETEHTPASCHSDAGSGQHVSAVGTSASWIMNCYYQRPGVFLRLLFFIKRAQDSVKILLILFRYSADK